jgi:uncharacterized protein involved in tolerance to divalent cations
MMSEQGFKKEPRVIVQREQLDNLIRKYKKVKKYTKSTIYAIKVMDGTENYVSQLIKEAQQDPISC